MQTEKHFWFKRKKYGYGWTPATWQGWLTTIVYFVGLVFIAFMHDIFTLNNYVENFTVSFFALTVVFLSISYLKGEKPKWQWGDVDSENKNTIHE